MSCRCDMSATCPRHMQLSRAMKHVTTYIDIYGIVFTKFMVLVDATDGVVQRDESSDIEMRMIPRNPLLTNQLVFGRIETDITIFRIDSKLRGKGKMKVYRGNVFTVENN
eukprot:scaffold153365_cov23-Cyclotella_meneghiniana.AAC.1